MTPTIWWCDMTSMMRAAPLLLAVLAGGCVEKEPGQKKIDPTYVKKNLLSAAPNVQHTVDAEMGGYVVYLGSDADKQELAPGATVTVVHYWKVVAPPGPEWRVFTHLVGAGKKWMNLDRSDMRTGYPPGEWKAGDIIRDEQTFTLDQDWKSPYAQLTIGLYRKGSSGPEDRMPVEKGRTDKEGRVLGFRFKVAGAGPQPMEYSIKRASGPIAVDGKADEADWQAAAKSPAFTPAEGGSKASGAARARLLWDDANLYAFIEIDDADVFSQYTERDAPLWKEDTVELFIDADRNRRGYVELQVNPRNAHFDAFFPRTRAQANHPEWNSGMKSAVAVRGTLDDRDDTDQGWSAEIAIPLADVKGTEADMKVNTPPAVGDRWRLNVIRVEKPKDSPLQASSWSAIPIADFHALARMVTVTFADEKGAVPAPAAAAPAPQPSETSSPAAGGARPKASAKPEPADKKNGAKQDG
jgi:hypothetical protein